MATQSNINVDEGTGPDIDFVTLPTSSNRRQVISIGDADTDSNYALIDGGGNLKVRTEATFVIRTSGTIEGNVASGATDSGNPVKIGYVARTALPTAVTAGQRVNSFGDTFGRAVVLTNAPRNLVFTNFTTISNTAETAIILAQGSGIFTDIDSIWITNTGNTQTMVTIRDVVAGNTIVAFNVPSMDMRGAIFASTPLPQTTANNNWTAQLSQAVVATVSVKYIKNQ